MIIKSSLEPLDYDDILLLPRRSNIDSRDDVSLVNKHGYIPIFSAPMLSISEPDVVIELDKLGGVGILHRFFTYDQKRYLAVDKIAKANPVNFGVSIGINNFEDELLFALYSTIIRHAKFVVIDTASGYMERTMEAVQQLSELRVKYKVDFKIIAGNVVDRLGANDLAMAGADIIRVNIGTGIQCLTSKAIGIGCPPLTAIADCAEIKDKFPDVMLLADGGISNPRRGLESLAFGADGLMIGSLFGRAKEAKNNGKIFGMSSYELQERMNKEKKSNEGTVTIFPKKEIRPLKEIFNEFTFGLKSGMSYLGIDDIKNMHIEEIEYIGVNNNVR
jgi:IMP dehydrogenase/GMP reductase